MDTERDGQTDRQTETKRESREAHTEGLRLHGPRAREQAPTACVSRADVARVGRDPGLLARLRLRPALGPPVGRSRSRIFGTTDLSRTRVLLLWRNEAAVVIGRNQNPWREANVAAVTADGIPLMRRRSGGGTVYHVRVSWSECVVNPHATTSHAPRVAWIECVVDLHTTTSNAPHVPWIECSLARRAPHSLTGTNGPSSQDLGNMNYSFLSDRRSFDKTATAHMVARALGRIGVTATVGVRNDLLVDGRKVRGASMCRWPGAMAPTRRGRRVMDGAWARTGLGRGLPPHRHGRLPPRDHADCSRLAAAAPLPHRATRPCARPSP